MRKSFTPTRRQAVSSVSCTASSQTSAFRKRRRPPSSPTAPSKRWRTFVVPTASQAPILSLPIPAGNGHCNSRGRPAPKSAKSRSTIRRRAIGSRQRSLDEAVDHNTRIVYLVDPNNPLGVCYTREEIQAFCDIARKVERLFTARLHLSGFCGRAYSRGAFLSGARYHDLQLLQMAWACWTAHRRRRREPPNHRASWPPIRPRRSAQAYIAQRAAQAGLAVKSRMDGGQFSASSAATSPPSKKPSIRLPGLLSADLSVAGKFRHYRMPSSRRAAGGAGRGLCAARHHDPAGLLSYPALRLALCQSQHHGSGRVDRCVLPRAAERDRSCPRAERSTGIVLTSRLAARLTSASSRTADDSVRLSRISQRPLSTCVKKSCKAKLNSAGSSRLIVWPVFGNTIKPAEGMVRLRNAPVPRQERSSSP